ncbi:MAG TPA: hypothetical protein VM240_07030 [Verrucomicrobiae bacterium]|nr:hypothetical protein [Verrucomicrobiae bacterium]
MMRFIGSLLLGTLLTFALFWGGFFAAEAERYAWSYLLYWQAWAMQQSLPCWTMAAAGSPLCEDPEVSRVVFYGGLPLGVFVYTGLFYALFTWRARRKTRAAAPPPSASSGGAAGSDTA